MFRVKESDDPRDYSWAAGVLAFSLLLAFAVDVSFAYITWQEFRALKVLQSVAETSTRSTVISLQRTVGLLAILTLTMCVSLVVSLGAMWWLFRRSLAHRHSLRQVKTLAYNILASMDQGVITTDADECITSINSAASALLGVDFECVGQPLEQIQPAELTLTSMSRRVAAGQGAVWDHDFAVRRNGRTLRLRGDAQVLKDMDSHSLGCVIHLRNVTDRVLMEERMSRMERFISLGSLASGLHHEIKNPLTALSIHVQLLEERLRDPNSTEPVDEIIGVLNTEVHRLNGVLESFRSFTNLQRLTIRQVNVVEVLENVIRLVRPQAAQQQVQMKLHYPDAELPQVPLDVEKFEQAVLNLVINALEAMPSGGINFDPRDFGR